MQTNGGRDTSNSSVDDGNDQDRRNFHKYESFEKTAERAMRYALLARIKPESFSSHMRSCKHKLEGHMTNEEKEKYFSGNMDNIQPDHLDITFMYKILRNTCTMEEPRMGWGKQPTPDNISQSDDIERIRCYRNYIKHSVKNMPRDAYNIRVLELKQAILRLSDGTMEISEDENLRDTYDNERQVPDLRHAQSEYRVKFFHYFIVIIAICVATCMTYIWNAFLQEDIINVPLHKPRINYEGSTLPDINPEKFWGTYRPNVYFGLKTRSKQSIVIGLMWLEQDFEGDKIQSVRHWCSEYDDVVKYGWLRHDGVNFGIHEVIEKTFKFNASFVKRQGGLHGGDWTVRVSANSKIKKKTHIISFFFYVALENDGVLKPIRHLKDHQILEIAGETSLLGSFRLRFPKLHVQSEYMLNNILVSGAKLNNLTQIVLHHLHKTILWGKTVYVLPRTAEKHANFIVHQITARLPFRFDVLFESGSFRRPNSLQDDVFTNELNSLSRNFDEKFEAVFRIKSKYIDKGVQFAKETLSNMLGSISYFYGTSLVQSKQSENVKKYWPATLYTTVPSRSKFPRGFLWNVGFDIFLINLWDVKMAEDIIAHWLDLMNMEGWIPREQILGSESASSSIPSRFIVQRNDIANPPSLFLGILNLIELRVANKTFLKRIFPRLETWFNWLHFSQHGEMPNSYYWKGRDNLTKEQLIPYTFASGLDDYPRASHPNGKERHLDLRCWIAMASTVLTKIAKLTNSECKGYEMIQKELNDEEFLDEMHWDNDKELYSDFGMHTDYLILNTTTKAREVNRAPKLGYVGAVGYVSLFPLMLRILDSDSPRLHRVLLDLQNEDLLWTNFGIRSLARNSPFYNKYNTVDDPPHWRGAIWINMNYLILSSLHHYSKVPGQYQELALDIYKKLKNNLIDNVYEEYDKKGYVFEQYNDITGSGQGSFPFTGWSALIVNIMAEKY